MNDCEMTDRMITPVRKTLNGDPPEFKVEPKQPMAVAQKQASDPVMMKFTEQEALLYKEDESLRIKKH